MNRIRNEIRNAGRRPARQELEESVVDGQASPLEAAIGAEAVRHYEGALQRLRDEDRELVVARIEFGMTYSEIAAATGRASMDAARMAVTRAMARLIEELPDDADGSG